MEPAEARSRCAVQPAPAAAHGAPSILRTGFLMKQPSGYSAPFPRGPLGHNSEKNVGFRVFGGAERDGRVP
eukprot:1840883-Prymnesium_polylepis.1